MKLGFQNGTMVMRGAVAQGSLLPVRQGRWRLKIQILPALDISILVDARQGISCIAGTERETW